MLGASGASAWGHGLGARRGTPEEQAAVSALYTEVRAVAPNEMARARADEERRAALGPQSLATATRPAAVDNSTSAWFPPIGNQGEQNSCVGWSVGYYYDTYTQARDEGIDVSKGDAAHICSPAFLYPLLNDGVDQGAYLEAAVAKLSVIGCSSLALTPYSESDYTTWPSEQAWVEALSRRTENAHWIAGSTDAGLEATKQLLANGRLAVMFVDMYANLYYDYPNGRGVDNGVLYAPDGPYWGGHTLTLVGYDDTRTYRDERDGATHVGAFLLANNWGGSWGVANSTGASKGFLWIPYDAFREQLFVYDPVYTDDRADYRPLVYALVGVNHSQRGYLTLAGGAGLPSAPTAITSPVLDHSGGVDLAIDSSQRIAVDLTEVAGSATAGRIADLFVALGVSGLATSDGVIASVDFLSDLDGDGAYASSPAPNVPVTVGDGKNGYGFLPLFSDLNWDHWAYGSIEACFDEGIVSGYADGAYRPTQAVTRDQMAVYISRALAGGESLVPPGPAAATFLDVPVGYWAFAHIEYAVANQVVTGYGDGCYQPGTAVDRGQMAVFIARAMADAADRPDLGFYDLPPAATFPDVPADFWACKYIEYLAGPSRAVVSGYTDGRYHPEYVCSRDQMAVFVARAFGLAG
jgi:C1A family cysteine protease